jgi:hypothetical protein
VVPHAILFRVAFHAEHDRDKLVVKTCRSQDGARVLLRAQEAYLNSRGVFIVQAPPGWQGARFYVWRGSQACDQAFHYAVNFVHEVSYSALGRHALGACSCSSPGQPSPAARARS